MPDIDNQRHSLNTASNALRTVACALVVLVHINLTIRSGIGTWWPAGFFFTPFFAVPVPAFFMLSGYFSGRFSPAVTRPGIISFLRKKARVLVVPFLAWNIILLLLHGRSRHLSPFEIIYYLFAGYWQLYYISVLLQLLVLHYYCERMLNDRRVNWIFAGAAVLSFAFGGLAEYMLWTRGAGSEFMETRLCSLFIPWAMFYAGGILLCRQKSLLDRLDHKRGRLIAATFLAYAAFYLELRFEDYWFGYNPLQQFLFSGIPFRALCPLLFLVMLNRLAKSGRFRAMMNLLASTGKETYGIYLCHTAVLVCLWSAWSAARFGTTHWIEVPIFWGATWLISLGTVRAMRPGRVQWLGSLLLGTTGRRYRVDEGR